MRAVYVPTASDTLVPARSTSSSKRGGRLGHLPCELPPSQHAMTASEVVAGDAHLGRMVTAPARPLLLACANPLVGRPLRGSCRDSAAA